MTTKGIILSTAFCMTKEGGRACSRYATQQTSWGSTFCDAHYGKLKEVIEQNEMAGYDRSVCAMRDCGHRSFNTVFNPVFPNNEQWLCEKHWRKARMTDIVQEKAGGWTLCNICHQELRLLDGFAKDAEGDLIAEPVKYIEKPVTCYYVTPAIVQHEQIPPCAVSGAFATGENWHKLYHRAFIICAFCFERFDAKPGYIPCDYRQGSLACTNPGIQCIENGTPTAWFCEEHWQWSPELVDLGLTDVAEL